MRGWSFVLILGLFMRSYAAEPTPAAPPGAPPGMGALALMLNVLEGNKPFSANAEMFLFSGQQLALQSEMAFSYRNGMARMEVDMAKIKSEKMTPKLLTGMKQLGLDKSIAWILPENKTMRTSYPELRAWCELPMPKNDAAVLLAKYKKSVHVEGEDKVFGIQCAKELVTLTPNKGDPVHVRVWRAKVLNGFPVQFELPEGENIVRMRFANLRLVPPALTDFTPPVGFERHKTLSSLLKVAAKRVEPKKK